VVHTADPEYSRQAKDAKFSGNVLVYLQVDTNGHTSHIRVARGVGMGLDEKAVLAVSQYRFKPATLGGKPVPVDLYISVNFQML
jgi:protein TonB